jgi:adenosylhomocysteine nucleosidase
MELFAIAYIANHYQIPWHSYKYITDEANETAANAWHQKVNHGQDAFVEKLKQLFS